MLEVRNLKTVYNDVMLTLKGVSMHIPEGAVVALLGANGAGKTTLARAICGLLPFQDGRVSEGSILLQGQDLTGLHPEKVISKGISMVPEGRRVFSQLTVEENLVAGAAGRRDRSFRTDIQEIWNWFPALKPKRTVRAGYLSGGEQQMLAIGRALIAKPRFLILDEPSLGLSPKFVDEILEIVRQINVQMKVTMLIIEQNAQAAFSVASYGYIMENGRMVMEADVEKLISDPDIKEFYLGITSDPLVRKSFLDVKSYRRRKRWLS